MLSNDHRQQLLDFATRVSRVSPTNPWTLDPTLKFASFVTMCETLANFGANKTDLLLGMQSALQDSVYAENWYLSQQALLVLYPQLPQCTTKDATKLPPWITNLISGLEGDSQPSNLQHMFTVIVTHVDILHPYRAALLPWIVNALSRCLINTSSSAQQDTRKLSLEVAGIVIKWDVEASVYKQPPKRQGSSSNLVSESPSRTPSPDARLTGKNRETLLNFLIISACSAQEAQPEKDSSPTCLELLEKVLAPNLWNSNSLSVARFDKLLQQVPTEVVSGHTYQNFCNALRILKLILGVLPVTTGLNQIVRIRSGLMRVSMCQHTDVMAAFKDLLHLLLSKFPFASNERSNSQSEVDVFYRHIVQSVEQIFTGFERPNASLYSLKPGLNILEVIEQNNNAQLMDQHLPGIMKTLQRLQKEHLLLSNNQEANYQPSENPTIVNILIKILNVSYRIALRADNQHRKPYVESLTKLAEKTNSSKLLCTIGVIASQALLERKTAMYPPKERAIVFNKVMLNFDRRFSKDQSITKLYDILLKIYQAKDANSDVTAKLEVSFMLGLRSSITKYREQFFQIYNSPVSTSSLHGRLDYCFNDRYTKWDTSKETFWVKHCLDTVLAGAIMKAPICPAFGVFRLPPLIPPPMTRPTATQESRRLARKAYEVFDEHENFLAMLRNITGESIIVPLRALCHVSCDLAYSLWVNTFPLFWQCIDEEERMSVGACLLQLLGQDYHTEQAHVRPNNVHALLTGFNRCVHPMPGPAPPLLYHLAKTHNLWHTGIAILRAQGLKLESHGDKVVDGKIDPIQDAMGDLYLHLGEVDTWFGLWRLRAKLTGSAKALAYEQQGFWEQAQIQYEDAMKQAVMHGVRDAEFRLWEDHWIKCAERLGQFDILLKFGDDTKNQDVMVKAAWKLKN
eukprot:m.89801 g.89801  ORF g.89801 m.89801 type:complete len:910 (+) comp13242_c0_seq1:1-2730(+)